MALSGTYYRALVEGRIRGIGPAIQRGGLYVASVPYGLGVRLRNWLFDRGWKRSYRPPIPVVSVGNLTLGGTGKTPCVEYVARRYREQGWRVAVLSRGYGGNGGRNDEALVLEESLPDVPHVQGADRAALAMIAVEELESQVLVLDDGFQHRSLQRDLDLVLVDATNPWGFGYLFPRGFLREPQAGLRRAGAILLTRCDQVTSSDRALLRATTMRLAPGVPVIETTHRPLELADSDQNTAALERIREVPAAAFCGIGNPAAFRRTLGDLGAVLSDFRVFPDHHAYDRADVDDLRAWAAQQAKDCVLVTTQKDLVKLRLAQLNGRKLWALRIGLQVETGQEVLDRKLDEVLPPAF